VVSTGSIVQGDALSAKVQGMWGIFPGLGFI